MKDDECMFCFRVPKELHRAVKQKCVGLGVPIGRVMVAFLEEWVKQVEEIEKKAAKE